MRYATFSDRSNPAPRLGIVRGDRIIDAASVIGAGWRGPAPSSLLDLIRQGPQAWQRMRELADGATGASFRPLGDVSVHAPIPRPLKNVFCLGRNYIAHAEEAARARGQDVKIPTVPVIFTKVPTAVAGPFDDSPVDRSVTQQVDWEVELGLVIGVTGRNISRADALRHVFGYTVINDLSARDLRRCRWFRKSLMASPDGPLVTPQTIQHPIKAPATA
jgi:2-keto-4-pentenoate hydratase/2-oxohepta-3-ene-1,7-dioic acid hydratase in catechol pathway